MVFPILPVSSSEAGKKHAYGRVVNPLAPTPRLHYISYLGDTATSLAGAQTALRYAGTGKTLSASGRCADYHISAESFIFLDCLPSLHSALWFSVFCVLSLGKPSCGMKISRLSTPGTFSPLPPAHISQNQNHGQYNRHQFKAILEKINYSLPK